MKEGFSSKPVPIPKGGGRLRGFHVLLVDDSEDNLNLFSRMLSMDGAQVRLARTGLDAVRQQRSHRFDAIVMDICMPEMDGCEATRVIRSEGYRGPIIALTANAHPGEEERCLSAGHSHFRQKPIDRHGLVLTIQYAHVHR